MTEEQHIKVLDSIEVYTAINDRDQWFPRVTAEGVKIQEEIKYPDGGSWPVIQIQCLKDNNILELDTINTRKGTFHSILFNKRINEIYLKELLSKFDLKIRYPETFALDVMFKNGYSSAAYLSFKICDKCGSVYMAIYAKRSESGRDDDNVLYVHGIWQVELSEKFKKELGMPLPY